MFNISRVYMSEKPAGSDPVGAAMLGAVVAAAPTVALAGNSGYALLQLGWAVFIISLGPAVTETEGLLRDRVS